MVGGAPAQGGRIALGRALWYRQVDRYPDTAPRMLYLGIVVVATIMLYYQLYVPGGVAPQILAHYHMSFRFYVDITVVLNAIGAFTSVLAGLADRWGRANLVAYGLGVTALLTLFAMPHAPDEWTFAVAFSAVGFVEGIILVATPALVRDFSPQLGRASAMGFWTLGPVVGSLVVAEVASHTLSHLVAWQDQLTICGIVGVVVFLVALFGLRELSPNLRDQLMVSMRDRSLVEARAKGIDVEGALRRPWRQVLRADIVLSAIAISLLLIIYYTAVGFNPIYFETIFSFSPSQANALGNWWWLANAIALVVVGVVSDRLRVRKPFMIVGAAGAVVMTIVYLGKATAPHTSYYTLAWTVAVLAIFLAIAFAPWMASFTETVEKRNPALTAHGLAIWGWVIRATVAISVFILPFVVSSTTVLVRYGTTVKAAEASVQKAPPVKVPYATTPQSLLTVVETHSVLFAKLASYPSATAIPPSVLGSAVTKVGVPALLEAQKYAAPLKVLSAHGVAVANAATETPSQWQHWWWVCVGGEVLFIPLVLLMTGRWSPRRAKRDEVEHDQEVQQELAKLEAGRSGGAATL
jgi:MFS family permease